MSSRLGRLCGPMLDSITPSMSARKTGSAPGRRPVFAARTPWFCSHASAVRWRRVGVPEGRAKGPGVGRLEYVPVPSPHSAFSPVPVLVPPRDPTLFWLRRSTGAQGPRGKCPQIAQSASRSRDVPVLRSRLDQISPAGPDRRARGPGPVRTRRGGTISRPGRGRTPAGLVAAVPSGPGRPTSAPRPTGRRTASRLPRPTAPRSDRRSGARRAGRAAHVGRCGVSRRARGAAMRLGGGRRLPRRRHGLFVAARPVTGRASSGITGGRPVGVTSGSSSRWNGPLQRSDGCHVPDENRGLVGRGGGDSGPVWPTSPDDPDLERKFPRVGGRVAGGRGSPLPRRRRGCSTPPIARSSHWGRRWCRSCSASSSDGRFTGSPHSALWGLIPSPLPTAVVSTGWPSPGSSGARNPDTGDGSPGDLVPRPPTVPATSSPAPRMSVQLCRLGRARPGADGGGPTRQPLAGRSSSARRLSRLSSRPFANWRSDCAMIPSSNRVTL